jgi:hypothetical protein
MIITVTRSQMPVTVAVGPFAQIFPAVCWTLKYPSGGCMIVQGEGWPAWVILGREGNQYTDDEIGDIVDEIIRVGVETSTIQLHRPEPPLLPDPTVMRIDL